MSDKLFFVRCPICNKGTASNRFAVRAHLNGHVKNKKLDRLKIIETETLMLQNRTNNVTPAICASNTIIAGKQRYGD